MTWVKGQSGNPAGAKKSAFKEDFDNLLAKKKMYDQGLQVLDEKWVEIIHAMAGCAIRGNVQAAVFLRDTFIGKPKETTEEEIPENSKQGLKLAYSIERSA